MYGSITFLRVTENVSFTLGQQATTQQVASLAPLALLRHRYADGGYIILVSFAQEEAYLEALREDTALLL